MEYYETLQRIIKGEIYSPRISVHNIDGCHSIFFRLSTDECADTDTYGLVNTLDKKDYVFNSNRFSWNLKPECITIEVKNMVIEKPIFLSVRYKEDFYDYYIMYKNCVFKDREEFILKDMLIHENCIWSKK